MTTIEPLPRSYLDARRIADPSIRMRVVTRGDAAELPEDPHELVPGAWSRGATAAAVLGTALITVGFAVGMWFVATNPPPGSEAGWFIGWNLFPWLFTLPVILTCGYFLTRSRRAHAFAADYDRLRQGTTRVEGILRDVAIGTSEGTITGLVVAVEFTWHRRARRIVANGDARLLQTEVPRLGTRVQLWLSPDGAVVVMQLAAGALAGAGPAEAPVGVGDQLAVLARLRADGSLSEAEFAAAKRQLLG